MFTRYLTEHFAAYASAYLAAGAVMLVLDLVWLHFVMRDIFRGTVGNMAVDPIRMLPAALFYFMFVAGLLVFAIMPAVNSSSMTAALCYGAFLGLLCYGTYDLTNMATLKVWTWRLVALDVAWGTLVSALSAWAGLVAYSAVASRN